MNVPLSVTHPPGHRDERNYILQTVLTEFLGLNWVAREGTDPETRIALGQGPGGPELVLPDVLFRTPDDHWLTLASLPKRPLCPWQALRELPEATLLRPSVPVLYGEPSPDGAWFAQEGGSIHLGLDIFGSAFFMLSGYEESVRTERDEHSRFPASASLAFHEGFLGRPLVDEYVELLWACLRRLWPRLSRRSPSYSVFLTHDVDHPLGCTVPWGVTLRNAVGDVVRRRDPWLAVRGLGIRLQGSRGRHEVDPYNTFDFIMDANEKHGLRGAFYFMAVQGGQGAGRAAYSLNTPWIRRLMFRVHERGHEIGLHPTYGTYADAARVGNESRFLKEVAGQLGIRQPTWGGRQHYLQWQPITWQWYEDPGLDYDATVGFADHAGFRCGTCREFPAFSLRTRQPLRLRERPLLVMDVTLLSRQHMALEPKSALAQIEHVSAACRRVGGTLSLLWHNSSLILPWQKRLYLEALEVVTAP